MKHSTPLSKNYRLLALLPALGLALLVGCAKSPEARAIDAAAEAYGHVKVGMSKQEVVARLGEPASKQGTRYRWETAAGRDFNASVEVRFDGADKVASVAMSRASSD